MKALALTLVLLTASAKTFACDAETLYERAKHRLLETTRFSRNDGVEIVYTNMKGAAEYMKNNAAEEKYRVLLTYDSQEIHQDQTVHRSNVAIMYFDEEFCSLKKLDGGSVDTLDHYPLPKMRTRE